MIPNNAAIPMAGHNNPPSKTEEIMQGLMESVKDRAEAILFPIRTALNKAEDEFAGKPIVNAEQCAKVSDFTKELKSSAKKLEALRVAEKEPFKVAGDAVHAFFKAKLDAIDKTTSSLSSLVTTYLNEEMRKKRLLDAAAADEARKLAAAQVETAVQLDNSGMTSQSDSSLSKAQSNLNQAAKLDLTAIAKPAELVRTRGESSLATLKTVWVGKVIDKDKLDLNQLKAFIPDADLQKFVNSFVRAGHHQLDGLHIYEESSAAIR